MQGMHIKLIKNDSRGIYNIPKFSFLNKCCSDVES